MKKICSTCKKEKNRNQFSKGCYECKKCANNRVSKWQRTPEGKAKHNKNHQAYRLRHPKRNMVENAKRNAKITSRECSITEHDFEIPTYCPILGIELKKGSNGKPIDSSPTLDRIDSSKGYIPGNVIVTSFRANTLRKNGTIKEFQTIITWLEKNGLP